MEEAINPYEELMIRVLDGYATEEEKKQLDNWLKESPANQTNFEDFKSIWFSASDVSILKELDVEADLKVVKQQVLVKKSADKTKVISLSFMKRVAAILLPLAIVSAALFLYFNPSMNHEPIVLSDGTKVWLYKDAKLDFPEQFSGKTRFVQLTGEAYFEVARDTNKHFIIEAGEANIEVLGTSFNVQSKVKNTNVIVNSGKVRLFARDAPEQAAELTKGEKGTYQNAILTEVINKDKNYRAWQNGIFEFDGTLPISEVVLQLSKYYGRISINTANPDCYLEATFEQEELNTVLETIKNSCKD